MNKKQIDPSYGYSNLQIPQYKLYDYKITSAKNIQDNKTCEKLCKNGKCQGIKYGEYYDAECWSCKKLLKESEKNNE